MLYAGERVEVTRQVGVPLKYACRGCGFASNAFALGRGQGMAHNLFFLNAGAEERAGEESHYAAHRDARQALALVRCPRCGARDHSAVRRFWLWSLVKVTMVLAAVVLGAGIFALQDARGTAWVFLGLGLPAAGFVMWMFDLRPRWNTVEARVSFDPSRLKHRRPNEPTAGQAFGSAPPR